MRDPQINFQLPTSNFQGDCAVNAQSPNPNSQRAFLGSWKLVIGSCLLFVLGNSSSALACPLCFGAEETSMIDGTRLGVLVLLAITLVVQGGFLGFFLYLRRRAKRMADMELDTEWSQLQGAPRTS